jgi:hypothetical protein
MELNEVNPSLDTPNFDGMLSISSGRIKSHELDGVIIKDFKKSANPSGKDDEDISTTLREKEIEYP